jgi:hypothetical protein
MRKIVLVITFCLFAGIVKADTFPWVSYISSKDSTVWVLVGTNFGVVTYRIDIDRYGKIVWREGNDTVLWNNIKKENKESSNDQQLAKKRRNSLDKDGNLWEIQGDYLYGTDKYDYNRITTAYQLPASDGVLHIGDNGKIWWGTYCFIGYYQKSPNYDYSFFGEGVRMFLIDAYKAQGTSIYLCEGDTGCPESEIKEPSPNDYDNLDDYHSAMSEYLAYEGGDGYPESLCFCDGRKIGHIKDVNGFVNFRTSPNMSAPVIGIILDRVRVFYWDNEDNGDWYKVEINEVKGYVHKSGIKPEQNEELEKGE